MNTYGLEKLELNMKTGKVQAVLCASIVYLAFTGCNNQSVEDAYSIRDSQTLAVMETYSGTDVVNDGNICDDSTKKTYAQNDKVYTVNAPNAVFLNADDVMTSNFFDMKIIDVQLGETVYDLYNITSREEADAAIEWDKNVGPTSGLGRQFDDDGSPNLPKRQLYFVKCQITNNYDEERWLCLNATIIRGKKSDGTVVPCPNEVMGFTGERVKYDYFNRGRGGEYRSVGFKAHEEKTIVLICSYVKKEYMSNKRGLYATDDNQISTYITSEILDGITSQSYNIKSGVQFLPVFVNGEPLHK